MNKYKRMIITTEHVYLCLSSIYVMGVSMILKLRDTEKVKIGIFALKRKYKFCVLHLILCG